MKQLPDNVSLVRNKFLYVLLALLQVRQLHVWPVPLNTLLKIQNVLNVLTFAPHVQIKILALLAPPDTSYKRVVETAFPVNPKLIFVSIVMLSISLLLIKSIVRAVKMA